MEQEPFNVDEYHGPIRDAAKFSDPSLGYKVVDHVSPRAYNLAGQKFNRITVLRPFSYDSRYRCYTWVCRCDCGTVFVILGNKITKKRATQSCGCLAREVSRESQDLMNIVKI